MIYSVQVEFSGDPFYKVLAVRRHLNLRQIEAFKAVLECGSVSRAAEVLHVSQSAASKLIAHLEFDTGLRLFDRVKGRLVPTKQAARLRDQVDRIFSGVRQVENAVDAIRREEQGSLAIGVMAPLAGSFIQQALSAFVADWPGVFCSVEMLSSHRSVERLIARSLDIALVSGATENPYIRFEPLMEHPLVCIMVPDHPLAAKTMVEIGDLEDMPFVAFHPNAFFASLIERAFDKAGVKPKVLLTADVAPTLCEFVAAGLGVSLVHPLTASGLRERLVMRPFEVDIPYTFQLARSADSQNARLLEAFAQKVRETARSISANMVKFS